MNCYFHYFFSFFPLFQLQASVSGFRLQLAASEPGRVAALLIIASQILITWAELIALFCTRGRQDYEAPALPPPPLPLHARWLALPLLTNRTTVSMTVTKMFGILHPIHSASLKQRVAK